MADVHTKEQRSRNMAAIRSKNTKPEILVRSYLHRNGYRFRLKSSYLPCKPDIILPRYKTVIFVHGCYWHRHGCKYTTTPKTNFEFWNKKFRENIKRDKINEESIIDYGWSFIKIWECDVLLNNFDIIKNNLKISTN